MTQRTYRLGHRQTSAERTRAKLITATRGLLMRKSGRIDFSLDAVAKRAGVTRLTVYHQFGSKVGLLEAVYDDLARRGQIAEGLREAFQRGSGEECLDAAVEAFARFWNAERPALRRLRSMATLDPDFAGAAQRDERRREAMGMIVRRLEADRGKPYPDATSIIVILTMLTSFETFDAIAGTEREVDSVIALLQKLVRAASQLD